jgi:hypothetical protein
MCTRVLYSVINCTYLSVLIHTCACVCASWYHTHNVRCKFFKKKLTFIYQLHFRHTSNGDAQQQTLLPPRRPTKRRTGLPVLFRHALAPRVPPPPHRTGVLPQEISWSGCSASNHAHVATDHDGFFGDAGMFRWVVKSGVATKPNTNSGAAHRGGSLGGSVLRRLLPHRSPRRCSRTTTNTHAGRRP